MSSDEESIDVQSREHAFAREFVFCIMYRWRPEWKPEGVFTMACDNSPFTNSMKIKVQEDALEDRHILQRSFEEEFPGAIIDDETFKVVAVELMDDYLRPSRFPIFNPVRFYNFCLKISRFAAMAVCFRLEFSPYVAIDSIYKAIRELQFKQIFNENSFSQLDRYCAGLPFE